MSREDAGRLGGLALKAKIGLEGLRERARNGGKKGIRVTADRHFGGIIAAAMEFIRNKGWEKRVGGLVDAKLDKQLAEGATICCEEIPVVCSPDSDPFFKEGDYWQKKIDAERRVRKR